MKGFVFVGEKFEGNFLLISKIPPNIVVFGSRKFYPMARFHVECHTAAFLHASRAGRLTNAPIGFRVSILGVRCSSTVDAPVSSFEKGSSRLNKNGQCVI